MILRCRPQSPVTGVQWNNTKWHEISNFSRNRGISLRIVCCSMLFSLLFLLIVKSPADLTLCPGTKFPGPSVSLFLLDSLGTMAASRMLPRSRDLDPVKVLITQRLIVRTQQANKESATVFSIYSQSILDPHLSHFLMVAKHGHPTRRTIRFESWHWKRG